MSPEREAAIRRLYETRNDHLPEPVRRLGNESGFVHRTVARLSCPDCLANDRPRFGCVTCGGRGWVDEPRDRDPYAVSDKVQPFGLDGTVHERRRERDREIGRLERQTREPWSSEADAIAQANREPYSWELARAKMMRDYDYRCLFRALDVLAEIARDDIKPLSPRWFAFVSHWMPSEIRAPSHCVCERATKLAAASKCDLCGGVAPSGAPVKGAALNSLELERRNEQIRRWDKEGKSRGWIMLRTGLGERQVRLIVNGQEAA